MRPNANLEGAKTPQGTAEKSVLSRDLIPGSMRTGRLRLSREFISGLLNIPRGDDLMSQEGVRFSFPQDLTHGSVGFGKTTHYLWGKHTKGSPS